MKIDIDEARRIALLAHLELDDARLEKMAAGMTSILTYIDQLREVDPEGMTVADGSPTPMRDDEPHQALDRALVEANAPAWRDGFFVVPKVLGGD